MVNTVDLHTHSTASDGLYSPKDLLQQAYEAGLKTLALTDHDSTEGIEEAAEAARHLNIDFIPGIELNTDVDGGEIHVLGYFLDYQHPTFQTTLKILRDVRVRRGERMVELLNEQGIHITWQHVRELAQGSVGRPHVAKALLEAGYVQSIGEAFDKYIGSGLPAYVPRYKLSPTDAVRLISSASGLAVIAHPIGFPGLDKLRAWLPALQTAGMAGLETYYGPYSHKDEEALLSLAKQYHLIPTGGTDFHGPGIHPTPLGGRFVPQEVVDRLKKLKAERETIAPPSFELPPPVEEK